MATQKNLEISELLKLKRPLTKKELADVDVNQHDVTEGIIMTAMQEIKSSLDAHMALAYGEEGRALSQLETDTEMDEMKSINATKATVEGWTKYVAESCEQFKASTMKSRHRIPALICKEFNEASSKMLFIEDPITAAAWGTLLITFIRDLHSTFSVETKTMKKWDILKSFKDVTSQFQYSFGGPDESEYN